MKYFSSLLVGLTVLASSPLFAQTEIVIDKIVAKVESRIILLSEVEKAKYEFLSNNGMNYPNLSCDIMKQFLLTKALVAKAEIDSVMVDPRMLEEQLNRRLSYMLDEYGGSEEIMEAKFGKSVAQFKDDVREVVREQMVVQKMQEEITKNISVTPGQVRKFFNSLPKDSLYFTEEVEISVLVKIPQAGKTQKEQVVAQLNQIRSEILAGSDFAQKARRFSDDLGSVEKGGQIGWHGKGDLAPEYEAAALKLTVGQISEPVETQFGFHIIQLIEKRANRFNTRHILIRPKAEEVDILAATKNLDTLRQKIVDKELEFTAAAKLYSEDKQTASQGGLLMDPMTREFQLKRGNLNPGIYNAIASMNVGDVSPPLPYRTDDGRQAVRLVYLKRQIPGHFADFEKDYPRIKAMALEQKREEALEKWLKQVLKELYIDLDEDFQACDIFTF